MSSDSTRRAVEALLAAIESRDLRRIRRSLAPDATWQNVPHQPAVGQDAVVAMLSDIVTWSDDVRWEVASAAFDGEMAWLERVDRFVIDGTEHAVRCNGVLVVANERVTAVRDYVDLGEWRGRIGPTLERLAARPPLEVVHRHLAAVQARDPVAMAADYGLGAVLVRDGVEHQGWDAIAGYFDTVPARLRRHHLRFGPITTDGRGQVIVGWQVTEHPDDVTPTVVASGSDRYAVEQGRIRTQLVTLDGEDF